MLANRGRDTTPELALRSELHGAGLRFRVSRRPIPGLARTADVLFTRQRVAIFIDGCFWHGCPEHGTQPRTHPEYWGPKLQRNQERDRETDQRLADAGWKTLRVWEHEPTTAAVERVLTVLERRSGA